MTDAREETGISDETVDVPIRAILHKSLGISHFRFGTDSKTNEQGGIDGHDAGKKVGARKRHLLVDVMGMVLAVVVHSAGVQDRDAAKLVIDRIRNRYAKLRLIWADGGYAGKLVD